MRKEQLRDLCIRPAVPHSDVENGVAQYVAQEENLVWSEW